MQQPCEAFVQMMQVTEAGSPDSMPINGSDRRSPPAWTIAWKKTSKPIPGQLWLSPIWKKYVRIAEKGVDGGMKYVFPSFVRAFEPCKELKYRSCHAFRNQSHHCLMNVFQPP